MKFHLLQRKYKFGPKVTVNLFLFILLPCQVHLVNSIKSDNNNNNNIENSYNQNKEFLREFNMAKEQFAKNSNLFGADLYKELATDPKENVVFSPLSIQTCLSMVYMAAEGRTYEEIGNVLKYGPQGNKQEVAKAFQDILDDTEKESGLEIANRIYVMSNYKLKAAFNELTAKHFKSAVESLDFAKRVDSAKAINTWVEEKTHNKIKDLISPDNLDELTRAVLVNAIYFKGKWLYPFDKRMTHPSPFWVTPEQSIDVDMMTIKKRFKYGALEKFDATALEMEYKDSNISMLFILPNKKDGLKEFEEKMHALDLKEIDGLMHHQEVEVFLPKFEFEFTKELNNVLVKLGMSTAFSNAADFSGLLESPEPLKISKVIHKAFIKVDEEGAEAAAATAVLVRLKKSCRMFDERIKFAVDHPFYFAIQQRKDEALFPLFSGSVQILPESQGKQEHDEL
uniref:CSON006085 protein n=1 Tax=Culicoides sonorensis TaxID=179676 RepID=A0A336LZU1_CULSO